MEKKYTIYPNGLKVDVVEARSDSNHKVQIAVLGDKALTRKPVGQYRDTELEKQGWIRLALVNGSIFWNEYSKSHVLGIEKSMGIVTDTNDKSYDNVMGFYHNDGVPYIYPQSALRTKLYDAKVRGIAISAFGLINNGLRDFRGGRIGDPHRSQFLTKSGRTIIGKRKDNTIVFAVFDGVTGKSGLTGYETYELAVKLGLHNAVCMDGGVSTYLRYKDQVLNGSSREVPNAIALYIKLNDL